MTRIDDGSKPKPTKLPRATVINVLEGSQGLSPSLELQVDIGGQDHNILLPLSELRTYGIGDQAVVEELREIRDSVDHVGEGIFHVFELLPPLFDSLAKAIKEKT